MKMKRLLVGGSALALGLMAGTASHLVEASDHDDGETDIKARALNLTDHYAFKTGTGGTAELSLIMYVNPRSLPGRQYYLSENARYEFHVNKVALKTAQPTNTNDYTFRIEAGPPNAAGVQALTLTVLTGTTVVGTSTGTSTSFAASKANTVTVNTSTVGAFPGMKLFVGQRSDGFHFDVHRFFQVRTFLANRFFGNAGMPSVATGPADLAPNCEGDAFLANFLTPGSDTDADGINLWNPASCAPDFTKNHNVTSIALNVPISALGGGTVFDTYSTISVKEVN